MRAFDDVVSSATEEVFAIVVVAFVNDFAIGSSASQFIVAVISVSIDVCVALGQVDSVVSVLALVIAVLPAFPAVDDIVAIAGTDIHVVCLVTVVACVDDIGITPEVFIEGVLSVLVVAVNVDSAVLRK